ncbi:hypothetical protein AB8P51_13350 [Muriicola sp. SD30]|uniref:hypothetical protein n=1 Tax=Muriicola sp. SD30 TaxID=3240936 RepID=UPI00350F95FA
MRSFNAHIGFLMFFCVSMTIAQEVHKIKIQIDTKNASPENAIHWSTSENTRVLDSGEFGPFTFFAQVGDHIQWDIMSLTEPDVPISITSLEYIRGPRIFSKNLIQGTEGTQATVIRGGKEYYVYELNFRIGNLSKVHQITSRIRIGD